jgi:predicted RNA-binding Zn-ribbon protein involved in translation (DUF1610 family)
VAGDRYTQGVPFRCPGCDASLAARPERFAQRCPACGALIRSRALDSDRRETLRRVEVPWDEPQRRRLAAWLLWSTAVTLGLVLVLLLLARLLR